MKIKTIPLYPCAGLLFFIFSLPLVAEESRVQAVDIYAPSLAGSKLVNNVQQPIVVYLPPSYFESGKHYPVIYFLHGYGDAPSQASEFIGAMDQHAKAGGLETIVVGVNGRNQYGGSFYVNSSVTGHWQDFVAKDVVSYVDSHYRTKAKPASRGLLGYSMGGYGAIHIGFNRADTFKHVMALCPGLFDENGLDKAVQQWTAEGWSDFLAGYAATFAPDNARQQAPFGRAWNPDDKATREMWQSGFGALPQKVNAYLHRTEKLASIRIEYGEKDPFVWITEGSRYLSGLLRQNKIEHEVYEHQGGHAIEPSAANIVDFFSRNLK